MQHIARCPTQPPLLFESPNRIRICSFDNYLTELRLNLTGSILNEYATAICMQCKILQHQVSMLPSNSPLSTRIPNTWSLRPQTCQSSHRLVTYGNLNTSLSLETLRCASNPREANWTHSHCKY